MEKINTIKYNNITVKPEDEALINRRFDLNIKITIPVKKRENLDLKVIQYPFRCNRKISAHYYQ